MLISRDNPPKIPSLKIESKNSQHKSSAHSNILQLVPICNAQMTCLSIGFYFYIGLKGYLLATLHELLKFTKTWNHFKLHMYNSVSTQFNRGMKMNRTGRTQHLYSFLLLCNKDPSPKNNRHLLFHSFHRSGFWTQSSWILCSGCHKATVKVSARQSSHLELGLFFRADSDCWKMCFLVVTWLRSCWRLAVYCSQLL